MVLVNYATKEIVAKIVYYGPGLCGKTTNLQQIFSRLNPRKRGKMISLATEADRTLFFDFLPLELGVVQGFKVRFQLYTVPGQVFYSATRKLVLKGADAVIFVADSQSDVLGKNIESYEDMRQNLLENNLDPSSIPLVIQYNKRDLPNVMDVKTLNAKINARHAPWFEAVATEGDGVIETFKEVTKLLIKDLKKKHAMMEGGVVEELPPEVFQPKVAPAVEEAPAEEEFVIERIHDRHDEPEEVPAAPAAPESAMKEMETISLSDTAQAEAFLDDVRKGAPAGEAKLKAEMMGGLTGDGPYERELTPDELEAASDFEPGGEEETFGAGALQEADEFPEMDFSAMMDAEGQTEEEPESVPEALASDLPEMDFPVAMDHDSAPGQEAFAGTMSYPEPVTPVEPVSAEEIWANEMPDIETQTRNEEPVQETEPEAISAQAMPAPATSAPSMPAPATSAPSMPAPATSAPSMPAPATSAPSMPAPATSAPSMPSPATSAPSMPSQPKPAQAAPEFPAPAQQTVVADTSELKKAIAKLEDEVVSLKFEIARLSAKIATDAGGSAAEERLEALGQSLISRAEGQDRLLLGILETVRDNKRAGTEALDRVESAIKNLLERYADGTKAAKKKWF